jgi:hypothetical protein
MDLTVVTGTTVAIVVIDPWELVVIIDEVELIVWVIEIVEIVLCAETLVDTYWLLAADAVASTDTYLLDGAVPAVSLVVT